MLPIHISRSSHFGRRGLSSISKRLDFHRRLTKKATRNTNIKIVSKVMLCPIDAVAQSITKALSCFSVRCSQFISIFMDATQLSGSNRLTAKVTGLARAADDARDETVTRGSHVPVRQENISSARTCHQCIPHQIGNTRTIPGHLPGAGVSPGRLLTEPYKILIFWVRRIVAVL
jgi:hypothetical protein